MFVDDMIWGGKSMSNSVINKFKTFFHVGAENKKAFTFDSINIRQKKDMSISLDQQKYAESLNTILLNQEQLLDNHQ